MDTIKKKPGCFKIFFLIVIFVVILLVLFVANALDLPRQWGLTHSKAEKIFDDTADREAAVQLTSELTTAGINTTGMTLYVLPEREGGGSAVYALLDASAGFVFTGSESGDPMLATMAAIVRSETAKADGIKEVAIEYKDASGATLITLGATTEDITAFADGTISEEAFIAKVGGKTNIKNVVQRASEILQ